MLPAVPRMKLTMLAPSDFCLRGRLERLLPSHDLGCCTKPTEIATAYGVLHCVAQSGGYTTSSQGLSDLSNFYTRAEDTSSARNTLAHLAILAPFRTEESDFRMGHEMEDSTVQTSKMQSFVALSQRPQPRCSLIDAVVSEWS